MTLTQRILNSDPDYLGMSDEDAEWGGLPP